MESAINGPPQLAEIIGIPHAEVELAKRNNERGVISRDFLGSRRPNILVHGNELFTEIWPTYPKDQKRGLSQHTVAKVISILSIDSIYPSGANLPSGMISAADVFVAYLMLDVLISNTDRHHENWAIIFEQQQDKSMKFVIAPTFDHASSLSRELPEDKRRMVLSEENPALSVQKYISRCRSAFYRTTKDNKPVSPIDAFKIAAQDRNTAAKSWLKRLADVSESDLSNAVQLIPSERMSELAKEYVLQMLQLSRRTLIEYANDL